MLSGDGSAPSSTSQSSLTANAHSPAQVEGAEEGLDDFGPRSILLRPGGLLMAIEAAKTLSFTVICPPGAGPLQLASQAWLGGLCRSLVPDVKP